MSKFYCRWIIVGIDIKEQNRPYCYVRTRNKTVIASACQGISLYFVSNFLILLFPVTFNSYEKHLFCCLFRSFLQYSCSNDCCIEDSILEHFLISNSCWSYRLYFHKSFRPLKRTLTTIKSVQIFNTVMEMT